MSQYFHCYHISRLAAHHTAGIKFDLCLRTRSKKKVLPRNFFYSWRKLCKKLETLRKKQFSSSGVWNVFYLTLHLNLCLLFMTAYFFEVFNILLCYSANTFLTVAQLLFCKLPSKKLIHRYLFLSLKIVSRPLKVEKGFCNCLKINERKLHRILMDTENIIWNTPYGYHNVAKWAKKWLSPSGIVH